MGPSVRTAASNLGDASADQAPRDRGPRLDGSPPPDAVTRDDSADAAGTVDPFAIQISASISTACAVLPDGQVSCWGSDLDGVLGDGDVDGAPGPVLVLGLQDALAIGLSNGAYTSTACALRKSGEIACWGSNKYGVLGDGTSTSRSEPVDVVGLPFATGLAVGDEFACALHADGTVSCWGSGEVGSLGQGKLESSPTPVTVKTIASATRIASSNYARHACALLQDQTIWCWGANNAGQLGDGSKTDSPFPLQLAGIAGATDVAVGESFTCALLQDGTVWCLGQNDYEQLGLASTADVSSPLQISGLSDVRAIAAGSSNACAILQDNSLHCWGAGAYNNLLDDRLVDSSAPVHLARLGPVARVAIGGYTHGGPATTLCAVKMDGTISCWGDNQHGQHGSAERAATLQPVTSSYGSVTAMGLGKGFSCALTAGVVHCAGSNVNGTLGDGTEVARVTPAVVNVPQTPIGLSAGITWHLHTSSVCALHQSGSVACWGRRGAAQDGNPGGSSTISQPTLVAGIDDAQQVEVGESSACALKGGGGLVLGQQLQWNSR